MARTENVDVFLLQETLLSVDTRFRLPGYRLFLLPWRQGLTRGCATLVKDHLDCHAVEEVIECGEEVEVLAVRILLRPQMPLHIYNIYRRPTAGIDVNELFTFASQELTLIGPGL